MLSGSHRLDVESTTGAAPEPEESLGRAGRVVHQVPDWAECLRNREQAVGPAGSVVHFSEALIHAGLAVLSETTRYAMFVDCTPSAMATGDKGTDTRVGWRPEEIVREPWDLAVSRHNIAAVWVAFSSSGLHSSQDGSDIVVDRGPSTTTPSSACTSCEQAQGVSIRRSSLLSNSLSIRRT